MAGTFRLLIVELKQNLFLPAQGAIIVPEPRKCAKSGLLQTANLIPNRVGVVLDDLCLLL